MLLKYDIDKEYTTTFSAVGLKRNEVYGLLHNVSKASKASKAADSSSEGLVVAVVDKPVPKAPEVVVPKKKYIKKNQTKDPWYNELEFTAGNGVAIDDFTI
jgi:hypothetical protein